MVEVLFDTTEQKNFTEELSRQVKDRTQNWNIEIWK